MSRYTALQSVKQASAVVSLAIAVLCMLAACGGSKPVGSGEGALKVVSTVSPITSIVENVGGTRIELKGIVPEGVNSHTYEPSISIAAALAEADLIILNGLNLEELVLDLAEANKRDGATILRLGDRTVAPGDYKFDFSFPESGGNPNPHLWTDPILAQKYGELVYLELARLDPANASYYSANFEELRRRIDVLDRSITASVTTVPPPNRKLLTYHDSWPYWADRYGFKVIGAIQPADFSEPSAREVVNMVKQIKEEEVPAIFGSEVFPSAVLEQIAKESGATYVDDLRDDDLPGSLGDPHHSYLGLMVRNMQIMLPALGGDATALTDVDTSLVFADGPSRTEYRE